MREIPKVKPSIGARGGESGGAGREEQRGWDVRENVAGELKEMTARRAEWWLFLGDRVCCCCVDLWHDDLREKNENHIARDYYTATVSAAGEETFSFSFETRIVAPFSCCSFDAFRKVYFLCCFFFIYFLKSPRLWIHHFDCTTVWRQDQWFSVFVLCVSKVSDQVQSLVDCWTVCVSNLFTVAKFFICAELMRSNDEKHLYFLSFQWKGASVKWLCRNPDRKLTGNLFSNCTNWESLINFAACVVFICIHNGAFFKGELQCFLT